MKVWLENGSGTEQRKQSSYSLSILCDGIVSVRYPTYAVPGNLGVRSDKSAGRVNVNSV